jgi:ELWxxDGT repeat protein
MFSALLARLWTRGTRSGKLARSPGRRRGSSCPLKLEQLEERWLLAAPVELTRNLVGNTIGEMVTFNGKLFFVSDDTNGNVQQLWSSDGTAAGTQIFKITDPKGSFPNDLTVMGANLYFGAFDANGKDVLWKTDGIPNDTILLTGLDNNPISNPGNLTNVNGILYFTANNTANGSQLWSSDGTPAHTAKIADLNKAGDGSYASDFTNVSGTLFFTANDGNGGVGLWKSNGGGAPVLVKDFVQGASAHHYNLTAVGNNLYFAAPDGMGGFELYETDSAGAQVNAVKDLSLVPFNQTGDAPNDRPFWTAFNGQLYFSASDGVNGFELWHSDGTAVGTQKVLANNQQEIRLPSYLTDNGNGTLFFSTETATDGYLWKTDGTQAGTQIVKDIPLGAFPEDGVPYDLTAVGPYVFFGADEALPTGSQLWQSDGTTANTFKIIINPNGESAPVRLANVNGTLFFSATNGMDGFQLWKLDVAAPAPAVTHFGIVAPAQTNPGASFSVTVAALDANNNPVPGYAGTVHFASTDNLAVVPKDYTFSAADAGVHPFVNGVTQETLGAQALVVSDVANGKVLGLSLINVVAPVVPGPVTHFQVVAAAVAYPGNPFSVTVTALDANNNVVPKYLGTVHLSSTDRLAELPANYTFTAADAGVHAFVNGVTLETLGAQSIKVTHMSGGPVGLANGQVLGGTLVNVVAAGAQQLAMELAFVQRVYQDLVHRLPSDAESQPLVKQLAAGTLTRAQVVLRVERTPAYRSALIQDLFTKYLHRAASPAELVNYALYLLPLSPVGTISIVGDLLPAEITVTGTPLRSLVGAERIIEILVSSQEYFMNRGGGTSNGFLNAMYGDTLNRAPTAQEQQQFSPALAGIGRAQVAVRILSGPEYHQVLVRGLIQRFLNRAATDAEVQAYAQQMMGGVCDEQVIAAIVGSAEYFAGV